MPRFLTATLLASAAILPGGPALAYQQPAAVEASATDSAFDRRAAELVDVINGNMAFDAYFAPSFQAAVPEAQFKTMTAGIIAQYGRAIAAEGAHSADGHSGTLKLRFEKGVATVLLDAGGAPDARVTGLRITGFTVADDSFARVSDEIAALPGMTGFLVAEVDDDSFRPVAATHADRQFAVGSTFKLYVLDELAAQIAAGKRRWSDVVPLSHLSFSSAATANWPKDTPVTLQTLANWMISVSDNGAADTLIHLLGRDAIEARMRAAGNSDPSRNIPFLTTVEAFALKGNNFTDLRGKFVAADDAAQRKLIDGNADKLVLGNVDGVSFTAGPRFIDSLEWFSSPEDIARLMIDLRKRGSEQVMAALAINNGLGPVAAEPWRYLGYKGGSENGVLSMSLLGQRKADGKWFVVTASWNNTDANVDTAVFSGLVARLLALAAK
ncbi:class A beta-lactamase-related serine hydrolase [Sphingopyxis sp. DBS4]|uniref:class A beta-lactamase-related serine hydrolase n=1 Tax=Sphingopyxis sp. DBS4 TaxID=2968500 RepID=UPI00214BFED5|nr:class A beta-lactamase-related serine hydrolase [Sphingopyxis sp. DBS4]